ncbi:MFS transporter [Pelagibacterium sp.]|uniref:MFS transporter n=1 Tax=Pelagibacterium sp. TaxID=1967288 RepID=UPI003BA99594
MRESAYGWVIVSITFLTLALVLGSRFSLGMFLPYMPQDIDASIADISAAMAVSMIGAAIVQPLTGAMIDRLGGRFVLSLGLICAGLSLVGTSLATSQWQVVMFIGVGGAIAYAAASPVSATSIVATWFKRRRGVALGITTSGTKLAMVILPPIVAALIVWSTWRTAMFWLGTAVLALIPAVLLLLKPAPGFAKPRPPTANVEAAVPSVTGSTLKQALAVRDFWLVAITLFANGLIMNLVFIHLPNYVLRAGYDESLAALGLALLGGIGILGTIATGTLSDWLGGRNVLLIMFGARGITALFVVVAPGPESLIAFVVVFGLLGYGAIGVIGALASELFGRKAIGAILGSAYVFNQLGGATGVFAGGASLAITGDYGASIWLAILTTVGSFMCILLIRGGRREPQVRLAP